MLVQVQVLSPALRNKGLTAQLCVTYSKQSYLQEKSHKQRAYRRCLRRFRYREFRNGNLSKSQVPTCRGPVRVETLIPSPQFVCKHRGSSRQEKSEDERNQSNQGRMGNDFEFQVSAQTKGRHEFPATASDPKACGNTTESAEACQ